MTATAPLGAIVQITVIADIGDVLLRTIPHAHHRLLASQTGLSWQEVAGRIERSGAELALERGEITPAEFASALRVVLACPALSEADVRRSWHAVLHTPVQTLAPVVARLATAGRLVLASNTNAMHWPVVTGLLAGVGITAPAWLSFEAGHSKPDARFFKTLLSSGLPIAPDALFVDDRPENVQAALDCGLRGWLHRDPADTAARLLAQDLDAGNAE